MLDTMTDNRLMFRTLMWAFVAEIPRSAWGDIRRLAALAWAVVGLCQGQAVSLAGKGRKSSPAGRQPDPLLPTLVGQPPGPRPGPV